IRSRHAHGRHLRPHRAVRGLRPRGRALPPHPRRRASLSWRRVAASTRAGRDVSGPPRTRADLPAVRPHQPSGFLGVTTLPAKILLVHAALDDAGLSHAFGGALALAWCTQRARGTIDIDVNVFVGVDEARHVFATLPAGVSWTAADL